MSACRMPAEPIDFRGLAASHDLRAVIEAELGPPSRGGKWVCPFHDDHNPSMGITPDGQRFRCWSCGGAGDVVDWRSRRDSVTLGEAARRLSEGLGTAPSLKLYDPTPKPAPAVLLSASPEWQEAVDDLIARAEAALWSKGGRDALDWLRGRGLLDHVIRRFRLGFIEADGRTGPVRRADGRCKAIAFSRGALIPWPAPGAWHSASTTPDGPRWVGANVRRLMPDVRERWHGPDKYKALSGSSRGFAFPIPDLCADVPALIVEGELDALLAWQHVGHLVNPVTVGGAGQAPRPEAVAELDRCPAWLVALDDDAAGLAGTSAWLARRPEKARPVRWPHGKDCTDFVLSGGDPIAFLESECRRMSTRRAVPA